MGFAAFFGGLLVFAVSPFDTLPIAPQDGTGLNPLLRHPSMMIHPPMLYSGYTLWAVPFAFAVGALVVRRVDAEWIRRDAPVRARRLVLPRRRHPARRALVLRRAGLGRLLGLGPGRERVAAAVADGHRVPALDHGAGEARDAEDVERVADPRRPARWRSSARSWCARGSWTRSTRSARSTLGVPFVVLIGAMIAGSVVLVVSRRDVLRSEHKLDSLLSREAMFLGNNLVLVGLAFVVFWGTFFPLISEAHHRQQAVARAALVRQVRRAAGARAGAAERHRAGDRVAARDAQERAAQLPVAGRHRRRHRDRAAAVRRRRAAVGAGDVRDRRLRDRHDRPGVRRAACAPGGR